MSTALKALHTKLTGQHNELLRQITDAGQHYHILSQQNKDLDVQLQQPYERSLRINPELEINRLHFITQLQEKKGQLSKLMQEQQETIEKQQHKLKKVKAELKMLELYLSRKELELQQKHRKMEEQQLEEWVLQKREFV